jgi:tetratricopeptide (TPR) repeat protein
MQLPHVRRARSLFKASLKRDERFAPAMSGLAQTYYWEWLLLARGERDLLELAQHLSRQAVASDPEGAHGLRELGLCALYMGQFDESLEAFAEAERRNPQHADLLADYADSLALSGKPAAALTKLETAFALNPLCPDIYWWNQGTIYYQLERYDAAIAAVSRMRDSAPAYRLLAACFAMRGEMGRAREYARQVRQTYPDFTVRKWLGMIPIRDEALRRSYEEGLRAAGFH